MFVAKRFVHGHLIRYFMTDVRMGHKKWNALARDLIKSNSNYLFCSFCVLLWIGKDFPMAVLNWSVKLQIVTSTKLLLMFVLSLLSIEYFALVFLMLLHFLLFIYLGLIHAKCFLNRTNKCP